jgi:hypothetical protein
MNNNLLGSPRHNFIANSQFIYPHYSASDIKRQFVNTPSYYNFHQNIDRNQRRANDNYKLTNNIENAQNQMGINAVSQSMIFSKPPDANIRESNGNLRGFKPVSLQNMGRLIQTIDDSQRKS